MKRISLKNANQAEYRNCNAMKVDFILLFFIVNVAAEVSIKQYGNNQNGTRLLLECEINPYSSLASWRLKGSVTPLTQCGASGVCTGYGSDNDYRYFSNSTGLYVNIVLTLNEDNKEWICKHGNDPEQKSIVKVFVPFYGPILTPNGTVTKTVGNTEVFVCLVKSFPAATLTWKISDSLMPTTSTPILNETTVISTIVYIVKKSDNGLTISCTAENSREKDIVNATLNVLHQPTVAVLPIYRPYNVMENATNINLTCNVIDTNPAVTSYRWYQNGSQMLKEVNATYTILTVQRSDHGNYRCDASNSVGSSDVSSDLQLNVLYGVDMNKIEERQPREGGNLTVTCSGQSNPVIKTNDIIWSKQNNNTFRQSGKDLVIFHVNRQDRGTYVCTVVIALIPSVGKPVNVTGTATVKVNVLYRPTVTLSPNSTHYNVIENTTNVKLTCSVLDANPAVLSYRWYTNGTQIVGEDATFTFQKIQKSNFGSYQCDATNIVEYSDLSPILQMNILYGVVMNRIKTQQPREGDKLFVTCSGQSNPVIKNSDVVWTKQNNSTFRLFGKDLLIPNVNREDSGTYVCSVALSLIPSFGESKNVTGTANANVDVFYPPTVTLSSNATSYNVIENTTDVKLTCYVLDANPAVRSYRWYNNDTQIAEVQATLTFQKVQKSDFGSYQCDALNSAGYSARSSVLQLEVLYGVYMDKIEEQKLKEGEKLMVTCSGQSNPVMKNSDVIWSKQKNNTFRQTGKDLVIPNANRQDSGTYICTVVIILKPTFGQSVNVTGTATVDVDVVYRPAVSVSSNYTLSNIIENSTDLQLTCSVIAANPDVLSYKWYRNGSQMNNVVTQHYTFVKVQRSDSGNYSCDAINAVGVSDVSPALTLNVLFPPEVTVIENKSVVEEGSDLVLKCQAAGNPPHYKFNGWTHLIAKETVRIFHEDTGQLILKNVSYRDAGIYKCSVTNGIKGFQKAEKSVNISFKPEFVEYQKVIPAKKGRNVSVAVWLFSYPDVQTPLQWSHDSDANNTVISNGSKILTTLVKAPINVTFYNTTAEIKDYAYKSSLHFINFELSLVGWYSLTAKNTFKANTLKLQVILSDVPSPPLDIKVTTITTTTITVSWTGGFNGGNKQIFFVNYLKIDDRIIETYNISEQENNKHYTLVLNNLEPSTTYLIYINASNIEGDAHAINNTLEVQTNDILASSHQSIIGPIGGGIGGTIVAIVIVVTVVIFLRRHKGLKEQKSERSHLTSSSDSNSVDDGLKDNILYETAGTSLTTKQDVYSVVNKKRVNKDVSGTDIKETILYAEVDKKKGIAKQGVDLQLNGDMENQVKRKKMKDRERDDVYENITPDQKATKLAHKSANKDGLVYADLVFSNNDSRGRRFIIRGIENKTDYADIDLSQKADPQSYEESDDEEKCTSTYDE